ncbi:hypothetical protein EX30DRAFT_366552 [Ascodesmis nigricans]|uniref:DUF1711-domain-containing protein n=1 Tax=Ascodesmis nigricans TaxID=341454 RepID=A0A4S2MLE0_9PEZI|nr:hypothetical protein EX30DRAFT_366552 [Ascodesmis nigricans]
MSSTSMSPSPATEPTAPSSVKQRRRPGPKPKAKGSPTGAGVPSTSAFLVRLRISQDKLRALTTFPPVTAPSPTENGTNGSPPSGENSARTSPPAPVSNTMTTPTAGNKRRGAPGGAPKSGGPVKRVRTSGIGTGPKVGGRKKGPLANIVLGAASAAPKLGPKSNTGAINDKLRALDRSGRPCKRWSKTGITLKSFTGVQWHVSTWGRPTAQTSSDGAADTSLIGTATNSDTASAEPSVSAGTPPDIQVHDFDTPHSSTPSVFPPGITA